MLFQSLLVGALLFGIGMVGFLSRRNMIVMFLAAEMMLQGVSVSFVAWGRYHNDWGGQIVVIFSLTVAACEAAIALALVLMLYHRNGKLDIDAWHEIRESNLPPYTDAELPETTEPAAAWPHLTPAGVEPSRDEAATERILHRARHRSYHDETLLILIPALPLAAAVLVACFGWLLKSRSHWPVVLAIGCSFLLSLMLLKEVNSGAETGSHRANASGRIGYEETYTLWNWVDVHDAFRENAVARLAGRREASADVRIAGDGDAGRRTTSFSIAVTLRADPLTSIMLAMVTFISTLVAIYSIGYMHGDRGYWRFFSYIGLFVFSMTMLVSASNFVLLFVFWEAVGLCSYLLIGFWYEKPVAVAAGKKAFLVNRVGDFCFVIGLFLIWTTYGTLDFHDTPTGQGCQPATPVVQTAGVLGQHRLGGARWRSVMSAERSARRFACCCWPGPAARAPSFRCMFGSPTRWKGPTPVSALDPRRHDGYGRRLHDCALHAAVRCRAASPACRGFDRLLHGAHGRR